MQAVGPPALDEAPGPRLRDLPEPVPERPSFLKRQARLLLRQAAGLSDAASDASSPTYPMGLPRKPSRIQGTQRGQLVPLPGSKSAGLLPRRHGQLPAEVPPPATLSPT